MQYNLSGNNLFVYDTSHKIMRVLEVDQLLSRLGRIHDNGTFSELEARDITIKMVGEALAPCFNEGEGLHELYRFIADRGFLTLETRKPFGENVPIVSKFYIINR